MRIGYPLKYFKRGKTELYLYQASDDNDSMYGTCGIPYASNECLCELITELVYRETKDVAFSLTILGELAERLNVSDNLKEPVRMDAYRSPEMQEVLDKDTVFWKAVHNLPCFKTAYDIYRDWKVSQLDGDIYDTDQFARIDGDKRKIMRCQACERYFLEDDAVPMLSDFDIDEMACPHCNGNAYETYI